MQVSMQDDEFCLLPLTDDREKPAYCEQNNSFPGLNSYGIQYSSQPSPDSIGRARRRQRFKASADLEGTINHISSIQRRERRTYTCIGIMVWALGGHSDLHVFHRGILTGVRYWKEIIDPYDRQYADAMGSNLILTDGNKQPRRAAVLEDYLEGHRLVRMEWLARSLHLNTIDDT